MKKMMSLILCMAFLFSLVACRASGNEASSDIFVSDRERSSWKDRIVTVLSDMNCYKKKDYDCKGVGLLDLNFDGTPELIVAYKGGSMGNVFLEAYDLISGEEVCAWVETPHYEDVYAVYFCTYRHDNGDYILVNKGALRDGVEWYELTSKITESLEFETLFSETMSSFENTRYYCGGNEVSLAEYEKQQAQFYDEYTEIKETQIQLVYWSTIEADTESKALAQMAKALIDSDQQFIDYRKLEGTAST